MTTTDIDLDGLRAELDDADRRAGAAERICAGLRDEAGKRQSWIQNAKDEAGYPRTTSFDVVWAETLERARQFQAVKALQDSLVERQRQCQSMQDAEFLLLLSGLQECASLLGLSVDASPEQVVQSLRVKLESCAFLNQ